VDRLSCVYTVGFRDAHPEFDRPRELGIRFADPTMDGRYRIEYPASYVVHSPENRAYRRELAAYLTPQSFDDDVVQSRIHVIRPENAAGSRWLGLFTLRFPVRFSDRSRRDRKFGALISTVPDPCKVATARVEHAFEETIGLRPTHDSAIGAERFVVLVEPVILEPGLYKLTSVLSESEDPIPHAKMVLGEIPEKIDSRPAITIHSILGRPAPDDTIVFLGRGSQEAETALSGVGSSFPALLQGGAGRNRHLIAELGFEPMVRRRFREGDAATVFTSLCRAPSKRELRRAKAKESAIVIRLKRQLHEIDGREFPVHVGSYEFDSHREVSCANIEDHIPPGVLVGGMRYVFQALVVDERGNEVKDAPRVNVEFDAVVREAEPAGE
jgi:hypothetical protein